MTPVWEAFLYVFVGFVFSNVWQMWLRRQWEQTRRWEMEQANQLVEATSAYPQSFPHRAVCNKCLQVRGVFNPDVPADWVCIECLSPEQEPPF